ncbi:dead end protein 1 [Scomber scombrus]|uniref:dead end protein 1 n=1 Tax=Scomber scombrus TaxID=13677 RepID=UPI002DDBE6C5|nr:dead end protein 1 [Scomber scombrus]
MMENTREQVLNVERVQALEAWLTTTNTKLAQVNGQRKYGGPPEMWTGPPPGARCEVFISQIPRDTYEDLLIPLFSSVGPLWEFRLMMNFSGQNRGFAYAKYGSVVVASEAIRVLHGHMLEPGFRLSVRRSTEKRHICIGDLPTTTKPDELLQVLRRLTDEVQRLSLKAGPGIKGVSAIVAYSSHHAASMAKKVLVEAFKKHFALSVSVKWQTSVKLSLDDHQQPSKSLQSSLLKPASHILNSLQPSVLSPHLDGPPSMTPGFCRAVGGPPIDPPQHPHPRCSSTYQEILSAAFLGCPVMRLSKMCELIGVGQPLYDIYNSHTGSDGFLYFTFKVCIPGITTPFKGLVMILPGSAGSNMLKEAQQAAAQKVLQSINNMQFTH